MKEIIAFFFCLGILTFIYLLLLLVVDTLKRIVREGRDYKKNNARETERKIHEWEVSDEYGWRMVELWEIGEGLELFAINQDGGHVEPRV